MSHPETKSLTLIACGPGSAKCKCACPDGPCEHKWDGAWVKTDDQGGESVTCSRCGKVAMDHDLWVAP